MYETHSVNMPAAMLAIGRSDLILLHDRTVPDTVHVVQQIISLACTVVGCLICMRMAMRIYIRFCSITSIHVAP